MDSELEPREQPRWRAEENNKWTPPLDPGSLQCAPLQGQKPRRTAELYLVDRKALWNGGLGKTASITWCVGVRFCDVRSGEFGGLPLAPDAQLLLCHLGFHSSVVLLKHHAEANINTDSKALLNLGIVIPDSSNPQGTDSHSAAGSSEAG